MTGSFLLDVWAKGALVLAAAWVATRAMRNASAAARHLVWSAAMLAVLCLPVLAALLPAWRVLPARDWATVLPPASPSARASSGGGSPARPASPTAELAAPRVPEHRRSMDFTTLLTIAWAAGALLCVAPALFGRWRLARLAPRCERVSDPVPLRPAREAAAQLDLHRPIVLLLHDEPAMPMTWGVFRPTVLLPRESLAWPVDRRRAVLLHELAHVKRLDCLTHVMALFARAVYWFNPLAWLAVGRMTVERERACDDLVLRAGLRQSDYARELLGVATTLPRAPRGLVAMAMAMARPSRMERRLRDVLDQRRNRRPVARRHVLAAAGLVALVTVPAACVKSRSGGADAAADAGTRGEPPRAQAVALPPPIPPQRMTPCQKNLAIIVRAAHAFAARHGVLCGDAGIGSLATEAAAAQKQLFPTDPAQPLAHYFLCDTDERRRHAPASPDPRWISENTLYRFVAHGVPVSYGAPDSVIVNEHVRWEGHGDRVNVGFWDGSVRSLDRATAQRAIEATRARIDAAWAERAARLEAQPGASAARNATLVKASSNMRGVGVAVLYYAMKHDQKLPPSLGASLEYGDDEYALPSRARMYLLPQDQHGVEWPPTPTPQWVDQHTSFVYLGAGVDLKKVPDPAGYETAVLHTKLDKPIRDPDGKDAVLLVFLDGHSELFPLSQARRVIEKSRQTLDAARG